MRSIACLSSCCMTHALPLFEDASSQPGADGVLSAVIVWTHTELQWQNAASVPRREARMPTYDYDCGRCGPFSESHPMAEFDRPQPCPGCGDSAPRALTLPA